MSSIKMVWIIKCLFSIMVISSFIMNISLVSEFHLSKEARFFCVSFIYLFLWSKLLTEQSLWPNFSQKTWIFCPTNWSIYYPISSCQIYWLTFNLPNSSTLSNILVKFCIDSCLHFIFIKHCILVLLRNRLRA